jgi:hypothetical protein
MGYVRAAEVEEKNADLQHQLNESLKVVQEKLAAASKWRQRAKDAESKLAAEQATIPSQRKAYAALMSSVQGLPESLW